MYAYSNYKGGYLVDTAAKETTDACNKPTLGERLKYCREEEGFSISEVASYLHCSTQLLQEYESNAKPVTYKDLVLLTCLYLHSMEYFCYPFLAETKSEGGTGAVLLQYAEYTDKFYHANSYFPDESEYDAIAIVTGYNTCPIEPFHHKKGE